MKSPVLHFIRKRSQLKASFIQNQILNHVAFAPAVVYRQRQESGEAGDGGFAADAGEALPLFDLGESENIFERLLFRLLKRISRRQKRMLLDYIKQIEPAVMHFHYGTDAGIYLRALRGIGTPKVVSFYGYDCSGFPRIFMGYGRSYLQRRVFRYADRVLAMSDDMKKDLMAAGCPEKKIMVHYYGTDVQRFHAVREYPVRKPVRFLIISGLVPQKGHAFLIRAFTVAVGEQPDITLSIVGSGPLEGVISRQIAATGMSGAITLAGPVEYASRQHLELLMAHDVFVHPSVTDRNGDKEGIPGAIVEAMAAGLPVISTCHAGIPTIIEDKKTCLLVDEWDTAALAHAIVKMARSATLRSQIGRAGQDFAMERLGLDRGEKELEDIFSHIAK